jgi:MFS family permease
MIERPLNRLSLAGLSATLVGNGLGRFAFIALMPALIQAGWFTKGEASYLSVATLLGYLLGALMSDALCRRFRVSTLLRGSMLACALSFLACAFEGSGVPWNYFWRLAAGFGGAVLMVLPAPVVLPRHDASVRGRASGVVFSGIGLGAVVSGVMVPALVTHSVTMAWLGMGGICMVLTLLSWREWPADADTQPGAVKQGEAHEALPSNIRVAVLLILAAHGLNAVGYLAHTLFWVDYIVRELKMPLAAGGFFWSVFGFGAAVGPMLTGTLADAFGLKRCLIAAFLIKGLAAALPLLSNDVVTLFASSFFMGVFTPGTVALVSAYTLDTVGAKHHRNVWGKTTLSFAAAQAVGGFLMASLAASLTSYRPLFLISAAALLGSVACVLCIRIKPALEPVPV